MSDNTIYVGEVITRSSGTRSGIKRFHSKVNQKTIQANSHIAKHNMFNTPGAATESFKLLEPSINELMYTSGLIYGIIGVGMVAGFYTIR